MMIAKKKKNVGLKPGTGDSGDSRLLLDVMKIDENSRHRLFSMQDLARPKFARAGIFRALGSYRRWLSSFQCKKTKPANYWLGNFACTYLDSRFV
jgi:hypothetical protein